MGDDKRIPPKRAQTTRDLYRVVEALLTHVAYFGKPKAKIVSIPYKSIMPPDIEFNHCNLILRIEAHWDEAEETGGNNEPSNFHEQ